MPFVVKNAKSVVEELFQRLADGDQTAIDDLLDERMVNHAAGPQGAEGWRAILAVIANDFGERRRIEHHHLVAEGELVAHHMTVHGTHQASTMPLLCGVPVSHRPVAWTYIHIWRVVDGKIVEHWACRDDLGLLRQVQP
jgi:predicted ester cyclase